MTLKPLLLSLGAFSIALAGLGATSLHAQSDAEPHWRTLRFDEVRMRVGPSQEYKIEWLYRRKGLPIMVLREREGWLLVQDHEGTQGWIASSQTLTTTGAMIIGEGLADLREEPRASSGLRWRAEPQVIGELLRCRDSFCEIDVAGRSGWVPMDRLWGAGRPEAAQNTSPEIIPE